MEDGLRIDRVDLLAVLFTDGTAAGKDNLLGQHHGALDEILDGGIRHVVAGDVDVAVVEGLGPVLIRHAAVGRDCIHAVDDAEEAANGCRLVVAVEAEGAAYGERLLDIAVAIEEGEDAHRTVEVGVPYGLRNVGLIEIELVGNHLAGSLPVIGILRVERYALVHDLAEAVAFGQILFGMLHKGRDIIAEERLGVHRAVDHGRGGRPVVGGNAGRPLGEACCVGRHPRSGVGPYLVDQLRVDLEPVGVVALVAGERRREPVVHESQGGAVGKPHAVADVIHPAFADLRVGGVDAIFLHHHEIEILDIGVVVGESPVDGFHLAHRLVEHEGALARLVHELVLIFKSVDVAHHLADPRAGYLVLELGAADLERLGAGEQKQGEKGKCRCLFHFSLGLAAIASLGMGRL